MPFVDSRRLTGANLFFAATGATLELAGLPPDEALLTDWRERVARARVHLAWPAAEIVVRRHAGGASLALAAPLDQLFLATEVNEWALCATLCEREPQRWSGMEAALLAAAIENAADATEVDPPVLNEPAAFARFSRLAAREARADLCALLAEAGKHHLPYVLDETLLTLGTGVGGRSYPLTALPRPVEVPWQALHGIPTVIVSGSNGKTTTVRLLAACAREHGWRAAYNCTDGVIVGSEVLASGDYSGPAGARRVLRETRTEAAVLEVARGGILRRGLAVVHAQVAVVTNISADHFGEYGIDDLDGLADTKLALAAGVPPDGLLVLNADDALLRAKAVGLARRYGSAPPLGWFALDADQALLQEHRARGGSTCGVRGGRLMLALAGNQAGEYELGAVSEMPLTVDGHAGYNIANLAGAALAAAALGIAPAAIAAVFARFGATVADNPGRLMRFNYRGARVLIDYAHNPDGLRGFLKVAANMRTAHGRLGLLLGHAGNRKDEDVRALAGVAAEFRPDLVVIKEDEAHLRGRSPGDVPRIIRQELLRLGMPESALPLRASELEAVQHALDWARPGDVLALPVHGTQARTAVLAMLNSSSQ
ncbi:MAG: Mur ligase family protein [Steroidobacteraceae bacterium]